MLRKLRIASQIICIILFCAFFFFVNTYSHAYTFPGDLFLRLNPLVALLAEIAARSIIPSVFLLGCAVALLTMLFGRFFCGFVCPLGATIDFADAILFKTSRSVNRRPPLFLQRLKYVILAALLLLSLFGAIFPLFMDPISLFTRTGTVVINPLLAFLGMNSLTLTGPFLEAIGLENLQMITIKTPFFYGVSSVSVLFLLVVAGSFWDRRFWCQYICPSGAFFGLLSRRPFFRRRSS